MHNHLIDDERRDVLSATIALLLASLLLILAVAILAGLVLEPPHPPPVFLPDALRPDLV